MGPTKVCLCWVCLCCWRVVISVILKTDTNYLILLKHLSVCSSPVCTIVWIQISNRQLLNLTWNEMGERNVLKVARHARYGLLITRSGADDDSLGYYQGCQRRTAIIVRSSLLVPFSSRACVLHKSRNHGSLLIQMSLEDYPCWGINPPMCHLTALRKAWKVKWWNNNVNRFL